MYASGSEHPLHEPCRQMVDAVADGPGSVAFEVALGLQDGVLQRLQGLR